MVQGAAAAGDARAQPAVQPTTGSAAPVKAASPQPGATAQPRSRQAAKSPQTRPAARSYGPPSRYLPNRFAGRAGAYYKYVWGIDSLSVKLMESGELVRFTWRVVDADRAGVLNNKQVAPSLIDPNAGVSLVVPTLEKIGQLRQSQAPEVGKAYWVAFSNKGRVVKRGDRVNVVIGPFRAEGLAVD